MNNKHAQIVQFLKDKINNGEQLNDLELFTLLLSYTLSKNTNFILIAATRLNQYGSLSKVFNLPYEKLKV